MKKYTNQFLISKLKKLSEILGRTPTCQDVGTKNNMPDRSVFKNRFGSWNNAIKASYLKINHDYRLWTKRQLIECLRAKYIELGRTPGIRDFDKDSDMPGKNTVRKIFGSWTKALREAGIPIKRFYSEDELINILKDVYSELNRTPTREDINKRKNCPSYTPFIEKFGSYTAACLRAGLVPNDGRNNNTWKSWQDHCEDMARVIYGDIQSQFKYKEIGIPDIYIPKEKMFIEVKTCGYKDFKNQIERYCKDGCIIEFWCIFKGIETRNNKVKYVYAEELANKMKRIGREDLAIKCYQFLNNVFSESQILLDSSQSI